MNNNEIYGIIYMIKNNVNGKIYFGQTIKNKGFDERYCSGRWWQYSGNEHLVNSAKKYGEDNFVVYKQFDVAYSQDELDKLEDMYICLYNTMNPKYGYNKKRGGSRGKNSEETNEKIRKNKKPQYGKDNPFYGHHHSDEWREMMKEVNSHPKTEQHKANLSKAKKGVCRKPVAQYTEDGVLVKVWDGPLKIVEELHLNGGSLNDFLKGRSKKSTYRGYVWKYYEEEGDY